ncbi:MAG: VTT domain-containing protein [Piscinibacter sp.]|nr:VTT domain-containing protein [Piscinibacter sp.]
MLSEGAAFWQAALAGMASPWVVCLVLALTTLLVEDLAIAAGAAVAAQGLLSWPASFAAVAGGIAGGDLLLYAAGAAALKWPALRRRWGGERALPLRDALQRRLPSAVLLARVIPGLRLLTYTACGWLRVPLLPFTGWVLLAVALWTAGLYALSAALGEALMRAWGLPAPVAVALPIIAFALAVPLWRRVRQSRRGVLS